MKRWAEASTSCSGDSSAASPSRLSSKERIWFTHLPSGVVLPWVAQLMPLLTLLTATHKQQESPYMKIEPLQLSEGVDGCESSEIDNFFDIILSSE
jgi:hypothetical protein